jgi:hypothetical protein
MPQGILGHGMPTDRQREFLSLGTGAGPSDSQVTAGAINFRELSDGKSYTLSEALNKAEWSRLLPDIQTFDPYIKEHIYSSSFKYYTAQNIITAVTSFLFLAATIGLFSRFLHFVTTPALSENEDDFESARVFTDVLGYFLAPFLITLSTAIINQIVLSIARKDAKKKHQLIIKNYKSLRSAFIDTHNNTMVFFALTEIIYELSQLHQDAQYYTKMQDIEKKIKSLSEKSSLDFNLCKNTGISQFIYLPITTIIDKLKAILLGPKFTFIMDQIKFNIKTNLLKIYGSSLPYSVIDAYGDKIDTDAYTHYIILDLIAEISIKKTKPTPSILLKTIQLTEESTESTIKTVLNKYWNSHTIKTPFIHPYDVDLCNLARLLNIKLQERYPQFVIIPPVPDPPIPILPVTAPVLHILPRSAPVLYSATPHIPFHHSTMPLPTEVYSPAAALIPGPSGAPASPVFT